MVGPYNDPFPAPLREFVRLFNAGRFWESHEVLEGPWRERGSEFYHGLILFASAFVHVARDNPHGIGAQLAKARRALAPYGPHYLGLDVGRLVERCREGARAVSERDGPPEEGRVAAVEPPALELSPDRIRGDEPELAARREGS